MNKNLNETMTELQHLGLPLSLNLTSGELGAILINTALVAGGK